VLFEHNGEDFSEQVAVLDDQDPLHPRTLLLAGLLRR
jgi:hypothetical protein